MPRFPGVEWVLHTHDTRALAVPNILAAMECGVTRFDSSIGGLGGCPFAPGASGNLPLEDLVPRLDAEGVRTGIDLNRLLDAARLACALVGRSVGSHVGAAGPRFASERSAG
jgi:hydroxymethylglutaryl-CoA lyase